MRRALPWSLGLHAAILAAALLVRCHAHTDTPSAPVGIEIETSAVVAAAPAAATVTASAGGGGAVASLHPSPAPRGVAHRAAAGADASPVGDTEVEDRGGGSGQGGAGGGNGRGDGDGGSGLALGAASPAMLADGMPPPPAARVKVSKARPARLIYPKHEGDSGHVFEALLTIDDDGYVVGVSLHHTGAPREELAAESAWRFRYEPALDDDGNPIRSRLEQQFILGD